MQHVPPMLKRHVEVQQYRKHYGRYLRRVKRLAAVPERAQPIVIAAKPPMPGVEQQKRRRIRDVFRIGRRR